MALDVYVQVDENPLLILTGLPELAFDGANNGYFWFLYPFFEKLATETGQRIDLYDVATFAGDLLLPLREVASQAQLLVAAQPEMWQVLTGRRDERLEENAVYATVERAEMSQILADLQRMTDAAIAGRGQVVFHGD